MIGVSCYYTPLEIYSRWRILNLWTREAGLHQITESLSSGHINAVLIVRLANQYFPFLHSLSLVLHVHPPPLANINATIYSAEGELHGALSPSDWRLQVHPRRHFTNYVIASTCHDIHILLHVYSKVPEGGWMCQSVRALLRSILRGKDEEPRNGGQH